MKKLENRIIAHFLLVEYRSTDRFRSTLKLIFSQRSRDE